MGRGKVRNGSGLVIHVWHTALRKEQVSARLQAGGWSFGSDWWLEWKNLPNGYRLWLRSDLPIFRVRGQIPLRLWVRAEKVGCCVVGVFLPPLWSVAVDVLTPLALTVAFFNKSARADSWWVPATLTVFMLLAPRLFTAWGRDRRLLEWVGAGLLNSASEDIVDA